jgi:hypothetical protein
VGNIFLVNALVNKIVKHLVQVRIGIKKASLSYSELNLILPCFCSFSFKTLSSLPC